ncbi:hypothetical protein I317_06890 [Kwoniella heveanensis CBS 569]|uniref:Uncharacterized protein n=1 Tax=Kwoniella heveanensis BCC8398 TaxID=1296120 RepID=A0A1B9GYK8_9TREE|nr:hypothetical protein I316_01996 [Kwoniella heveanensis BCC8398]OCF39308.1 hypothetical protein I317_06890 [Kwoniella heveanensis CBS 569]
MSFSAQAAHDAMEQHIATTNNDSDREEQTSNAVSDSAIGGASLPGEASGQSASSRPVTPTSSDMSGEAHTQPPPRRKAVYRALSNRFEGVRSNIEQRPTDSSVGTELSRSIDASSRVHPSSKGDLHRELNRALKAATNVYAHASASMPEATTSSEVYASDLFKDYVDEDGTRTGQTPLNLKDDEHGFQKLMYDATARSGVQEGFTDIRVGFTDTAFGHTWKQLESGKRRDRSLRGLVGDPIDSVFQDPKTSRWALRQQLEDEREDQQSHRPGGDQLGDVSESERSED